jgi:hypothetical protein
MKADWGMLWAEEWKPIRTVSSCSERERKIHCNHCNSGLTLLMAPNTEVTWWQVHCVWGVVQQLPVHGVQYVLDSVRHMVMVVVWCDVTLLMSMLAHSLDGGIKVQRFHSSALVLMVMSGSLNASSPDINHVTLFLFVLTCLFCYSLWTGLDVWCTQPCDILQLAIFTSSVVTTQSLRDLHQCAEFCFLLTSRGGWWHKFIYYF